MFGSRLPLKFFPSLLPHPLPFQGGEKKQRLRRQQNFHVCDISMKTLNDGSPPPLFILRRDFLNEGFLLGDPPPSLTTSSDDAFAIHCVLKHTPTAATVMQKCTWCAANGPRAWFNLPELKPEPVLRCCKKMLKARYKAAPNLMSLKRHVWKAITILVTVLEAN